MTSSPEKIRPTSIFLALPFIFIVALGIRTISSGSFWMHLASGRYIAAHGIPASDPFSFLTRTHQPWLNDSWLYDVIVYLLWNMGRAPAVIIVHAAAILVAFALLARTAKNQAGAASIGLALLACGWLMAPQFTISPGILSLILPALFVATLSRDTTSRVTMALLVAGQVLWTNLHISFLLGPCIAALGAWQMRPSGNPSGDSVQFTRRLALTALMLGATLINPYGLRLPAAALHWLLDPNFSTAMEWISPYSNAFHFPWGGRLVTVLLALVASGFIFIRIRLPVMITTLAVVGAFLLVRSVRFSALSAVLIFPFLCLGLHAMGNAIGALVPLLRRFGCIASGALSVASIGLVITNAYYSHSGNASSFGLGLQSDAFPSAALEEALAGEKTSARMLNLPMDGGYLAFHRPGEKIFCDTRMPLYGPIFYQHLQRALGGDQVIWKKMLGAWRPSSILLNCTWLGASSDMSTLLASGAWSLAYFDGTSAWLVSDPGKVSAAVQKAGLDILESARRDYASTSGRFFSRGNPSRLIGAASVFQALGKYKEAEALFYQLTRVTPGMNSAWLGLCNSQIELMKLDDAAQTLAFAEKRLSLRGRVWLWVNLHHAYLRAGDEDKAAEAVEKARLLDSKFAELCLGDTAQAEDRPE